MLQERIRDITAQHGPAGPFSALPNHLIAIVQRQED